MAQEYSEDARDLVERFELRGVLNDEKKVLTFCCGCCRLIWDRLPKIAQDALEVSEKYINGSASIQDLIDARTKLWNFIGEDFMNFEMPHISATRAVICCLYEVKNLDEAFDAACYVMSFSNNVEVKTAEHVELLLKIFGQPEK